VQFHWAPAVHTHLAQLAMSRLYVPSVTGVFCICRTCVPTCTISYEVLTRHASESAGRAPAQLDGPLLCDETSVFPRCFYLDLLLNRVWAMLCEGLRLDVTQMVALGGVATLRTQYLAAVTVPARACLFGALLAHALEEEEETTGSPERQLDRRRVASWAMDAGMAEAAWVPFRLFTTGFAAPMVRVPHTLSLRDWMAAVAKPLVSNTARRHQPTPNHFAFWRRS
jgi:hypothetical protein